MDGLNTSFLLGWPIFRLNVSLGSVTSAFYWTFFAPVAWCFSNVTKSRQNSLLEISFIFLGNRMPSFENKQCKTIFAASTASIVVATSETALTFVSSLFGSFVWNFATGLRASEVWKGHRQTQSRIKSPDQNLCFSPNSFSYRGSYFKYRGEGSRKCYLSMLFGVYAGIITCFYK